MTLKEALIGELDGVEVSNLSLQKALLDQGLTEDQTYTASSRTVVDQAALSVLERLLSAADLTEGGLSTKLDRAAIQRRMDGIRERIGISSSSKPAVRDRSGSW